MAAHRVLLPFISSALLATWLASASAQVVRPDVWGTDFGVSSLARVGNTLFIAGRFGWIGSSCGGGVPLDRFSGAPAPRFARVAGIVRAVVPDGDGGWFIGGDFNAVEGRPHAFVAHVRADGSVADWDPGIEDAAYGYKPADVNPIGTVSSLALHGHTLYVGGAFVRVAGQTRSHLAAVDARTGRLLAFDPGVSGAVTALAIRANTLYVGGGFDHVGGVARFGVAALDLPSGRLTGWNPSADGAVRAFAWQGRTMFLGGEFDHVGGIARNSIAAVDLETGAPAAWDAKLLPVRQYLPHGDRVWPIVSSLLVRGPVLYVAGWFGSIGGREQTVVAALDVATGAATSFDAKAGGGYGKSLALDGGTLHVGGHFYSFGDSVRPNLGAVDARTGAPTRWNPRAYGTPYALAADRGRVFAGGDFSFMYDWRACPGLAAIDLTTGVPRDWSPALDATQISDMLAIGNTLYVAGEFTKVNGQQRGHLAAFDGATGELTPWNPWSEQVTPAQVWSDHTIYPIQAMTAIGNTLYVAGQFEEIDGIPRRELAAIDATTGAILDWAPHLPWADNKIDALGTRADTIFAAGQFRDPERYLRHVAAFDATTALETGWNPEGPPPHAEFDLGILYAIAPTERGVYVGGWFLTAARVPRIGLAAIDAAGGILPFDARMDSDYAWFVGEQPAVRALMPFGDQLVVGGKFDQIGGRRIPNLAVLDARTGDALDWNPDAIHHPNLYWPNGVEALARSGDTLYVGGGFRRFGGYPSGGVAVVIMPHPRPRLAAPLASGGALAPAFALEPPRPNPSRAGTEIRFALPAASEATLEVFDVQGRRVASPLDRVAMSAGPHAVALATRDWQTGVYWCRLSAAGRMATRKLLVIR